MKFNYHIIILLLLIVRLFTPSTAKASQNYINNLYPSDNDEFETLMEKIRKDFAQNPLIDEFLHKYDTAKGCFTDVDYSRRDRTNWEPLTHIDRLYDFAFAYTNPQNTYYQNEDIYNKIVKGLDYWYERNPNCNNWWYNQIAEPQKIGILLIQMRVGKKQIPAELETKTLQRIREDTAVKQVHAPNLLSGHTRKIYAFRCTGQRHKPERYYRQKRHRPICRTYGGSRSGTY